MKIGRKDREIARSTKKHKMQKNEWMNLRNKRMNQRFKNNKLTRFKGIYFFCYTGKRQNKIRKRDN